MPDDNNNMQPLECSAFSLHHLFETTGNGKAEEIVSSRHFNRTRRDDAGLTTSLLDRFPGTGASCCFIRLQQGPARTFSFIAEGAYLLEGCPSGGWILKPAQTGLPAYWIAQAPMLRTLDDCGHITAERPASVVGIRASTAEK